MSKYRDEFEKIEASDELKNAVCNRAINSSGSSAKYRIKNKPKRNIKRRILAVSAAAVFLMVVMIPVMISVRDNLGGINMDNSAPESPAGGGENANGGTDGNLEEETCNMEAADTDEDNGYL